MEIPEGKKREMGAENLFEEKIAENVPNLGKKTDIQETQKSRQHRESQTR